jgi:hypothetical protein
MHYGFHIAGIVTLTFLILVFFWRVLLRLAFAWGVCDLIRDASSSALAFLIPFAFSIER